MQVPHPFALNGRSQPNVLGSTDSNLAHVFALMDFPSHGKLYARLSRPSLDRGRRGCVLGLRRPSEDHGMMIASASAQAQAGLIASASTQAQAGRQAAHRSKSRCCAG
jgi:hypothetical protein